MLMQGAELLLASRQIAGLPRRFVILDTEYTAWEGSLERHWSNPGEHRELVELAAIRVEASTLAEIGSFRRLVRPRLRPLLSDYLVRLTGISQAEVDAGGLDASQAIAAFVYWAGADALYCFGRDDFVIRQNISLYGLDPTVFPCAVEDIRPLFAAQGIDMAGLSSGTCTRALGIEPTLSAHSGLNDVRTILSALRLLADRGSERE
jgi:inhibitor of KinA sporulation pathway (predicted exonuclease)